GALVVLTRKVGPLEPRARSDPMADTPDTAERFAIHVDQGVLDDLQVRLRKTRWTHTSKDAGWQLGTSRRYLRELIEYWAEQYDWRAHEAALNALPHFMARVERTDLHFVHERGRGTSRTPLLLLHGWPDSFLEVPELLAQDIRAFFRPLR